MNDDLIIPRIIRDNTGNFANVSPRPFDILQVGDHYCFGDGTLAHKARISYLDKNTILVPLRMSRMLDKPFQVYSRLARQHFASAGPGGAKLTFTVEIDINRVLSQEKCVQMCRDFGFDNTHPLIQSVCSTDSRTDQFVFSCNFRNDAVTVLPITFELGKPVALNHIYIAGFDQSRSTLENVEFKFYGHVRPDKIEVFFAKPFHYTWPKFIAKVKTFLSNCTDFCSWSDANIDGTGTSVMILYPRNRTRNFVTLICSEFSISQHMIKFSHYDYGGPLMIGFYKKPECELSRIIMNAVVCLGGTLTAFDILYVLDYLPCMWIYSRLEKMRRLETCFRIIRDVRNKRVYSD